MACPSLTLADVGPDHADRLIALFRVSVRVGAAPDYSPAQLAAWAPDAITPAVWRERLGGRLIWVARRDGADAGFCALEPDGHLDMLFVHPDHVRRGVARALLARAEATMVGMGRPRLFTEASLTARPFFERSGFVVQQAQEVEVRGQRLRNFRMEKVLSRGAPRPRTD